MDFVVVVKVDAVMSLEGRFFDGGKSRFCDGGVCDGGKGRFCKGGEAGFSDGGEG